MNKLQKKQFDKAVSAHTDGDYDAAERLYKQLLEEVRDPKVLSYLSEILMHREEYEEAEHLLDEALELDFEDATIWLNIANLHYLQEDAEKAIPAFEKVLALDPEDKIAPYQIAVLKGETKQAEKYQAQFAEHLFDDYAVHFESALVDDLNYATPTNFQKILKKVLGRKWFAEKILDIGCGTGLVGALIGDRCEQLDGVDLSESMLDIAAEKDIYSTLYKDDVVAFLDETEDVYDLMTAADVLVYLGDLRAFFQKTHACLSKEGYLLLSVEDGKIPFMKSFVVQPSGRFCHKKSYVEKCANKYGFSIVHYAHLRLRDESGEALMGHHFLLQKCA